MVFLLPRRSSPTDIPPLSSCPQELRAIFAARPGGLPRAPWKPALAAQRTFSRKLDTGCFESGVGKWIERGCFDRNTLAAGLATSLLGNTPFIGRIRGMAGALPWQRPDAMLRSGFTHCLRVGWEGFYTNAVFVNLSRSAESRL